jgi:hypothetical protein
MMPAPTRLLPNPVMLALLGKAVFPQKVVPFDKVTAALAVGAASLAHDDPSSLLFVVPEGTQDTARFITAGLLVGNYGYEHGRSHLRPEEAGRFLKGSVLLITPAVSECTVDLESILLGGATRLTDIWEIVPLAKQQPPGTNKQRLYVANPGWAMSRMKSRKFCAIIIDATHPRTLSSLPQLVALAKEVSPIQFVVSPPLQRSQYKQIGFTDQPDTWFWDPGARAESYVAIDAGRQDPPPPARHILSTCDDDQEADELLSAAYRTLAEVSKLSNGRDYPGLQLAWSVLNRLRNLTVSLTAFEQAASKTWGGGLSQRMRSLQQIEGHGYAVWDSTWPALKTSIEHAYNGFLLRKEPAKFWTLASRVDSLLAAKSNIFRVVAPSLIEAELLSGALHEVVDGFSEALISGRVEIITGHAEAILIADGVVKRTLLIGVRSGKYRHLNLFPSHPMEHFLYPFEARIERAALTQQYELSAELQTQGREALLSKFGMMALANLSDLKPIAPRIELKRGDGRPVTFVKHSSTDVDLDLESLASSDTIDRGRAYEGMEREASSRSGDVYEVLYVGGLRLQYPAEQSLDVFFSDTDQIHRERVNRLVPGIRIIRFVDGHYDSLFFRTTEALKRRLSTHDRFALELWDKTKDQLESKFTSKRELYEKLVKDGLTSTYATFCTWVREEDDTMAPQQIEEFMIVAKATGAFPTDELIRRTFKCVQQVRGRNRAAGRKLKSVLRALQAEAGYEDALDSVRRVDPDLADVYAAVDVVEVVSVRQIVNEVEL